MYKRLYLGILFICMPCFAKERKKSHEIYDVTVVGYLLFANGLGRNGIAALDFLQDSLKMNFVPTRRGSSFKDMPEKVAELVKKKNKNRSNVAILYDVLTFPKNAPYKKMPESTIKIAYSMVESTEIPQEWTDILNGHFDAVVVPDIYYKEVYKNSGVTKPIFVLAHPVYLDEFLAQPLKTKPNDTFTFGVSCVLSKKRIVNCS